MDKRYNYCKENGICVRCRKEKASLGKIMCESCAKKDNQRTKENREALKGMGICPRCGRNKLWGDEKNCIECRAKMYEYNLTHKTKSTKNYNKIRKENGLCIKCGKKPPVKGKTKCATCAAKERIRAREYRMRKGVDIDRSERPSYGKCYFCGAQIESGRICGSCKKRVMKNLSFSTGNNSWREENKIVFGGRKNAKKINNYDAVP